MTASASIIGAAWTPGSCLPPVWSALPHFSAGALLPTEVRESDGQVREVKKKEMKIRPLKPTSSLCELNNLACPEGCVWVSMLKEALRRVALTRFSGRLD